MNEEEIRAMLAQMIAGLNAAFFDAARIIRRGAENVNNANVGGQRSAGPNAGGIGGVIQGALRPLAAALLPIASFAAILGQSTSGLRLFVQAVGILGATLAPVLLPVFVLLAAVALSVADIIWEKLEPALKDFYVAVLTTAVPAIASFVQALTDHGHVIGQAGDFILNAAKFAAAHIAQFAAMALQKVDKDHALLLWAFAQKLFGEIAGKEKEKRDADAARRKANEQDLIKRGIMAPPGAGAVIGGIGAVPGIGMERRGGQAGGGQAGGFAGKLVQRLKDVMQQLSMDNLSKASITGLVEASKQAQVAFLNQTPFEAELLKRMQAVINIMQEAIAVLDGPAVVR
jgi:hypothetical protein